MIKIIFFVVFAFFSNTAHAACINPTGSAGDFMYNTTYDVFQGCTERGWYAFHEASPPPPVPGEVMPDGSVYVGLSPDGNVPMYTTPADAGSFTWDDDGIYGGHTDTAMVNCNNTESSCITGEANTELLVTADSNNGIGGVQPHDAAQYCYDLIAHGQNDWYLPSLDELNILYINRIEIGNFNTSGSFPVGYYWSSSERSNIYAFTQIFSGGTQSNTGRKDFSLKLRCVRK